MSAFKILQAQVFLLLVFGLSSCGNRPAAFDFTGVQLERAPGVNAETGAEGLWIATSDYRSNGWLTRLDLATGQLERRIRAVGADIYLAPDSAQSFFLLTRGGVDSIESFSGREARLEASFPLAKLSNPQFAARDSRGRVWVTTMQSNIVEVLSSDLRTRVGGVDISPLADDHDRLAEPYGIIRAGLGRMAVVAARLERTPTHWRPNPRAGIALLGEESLRMEDSRLLSVANALHIFSPMPGFLAVLGMGSQDATYALSGGLEIIGPQQGLRAVETRAFTSRVVAGAMASDGTLATIEWSPEEGRSCLRYGYRELFCEGGANGFIFSNLAISGKFLFVSYAKDGNSELWVVPVDGGRVERLPMEQPILSLVLGP